MTVENKHVLRWKEMNQQDLIENRFDVLPFLLYIIQTSTTVTLR